MFIFFFFNDTATTEIYTLSLHDALPISYQQLLRPGERIDPVQIGIARGVLVDGRIRLTVLHPRDVYQIALVLARAPDRMHGEWRSLNALGGQGLRETDDGANGISEPATCR